MQKCVLDDIQFNCVFLKTGEAASFSFFIDFVLKRYDELCECVAALNRPIENEAGIAYFLFKLSLSDVISKMPEMGIPIDEQEKLKRLDSLLVKNENGFCVFVNSNHHLLFDQIHERKGNSLSLSIQCLKCAFERYSSSLDQATIDSALSNCAGYILADYVPFSAYFKKHKSAFPRLFDGLDQITLHSSRTYVQFLTTFHGSPENEKLVRENAEKLCCRFLHDFENLATQSDDPFMIENKTYFDAYYALARRHRLACANAYREICETYERTFNQYLIQYGQNFKTEEFDIRPAIDMLKRDSNPYKFMRLTLAYDVSKKELVHFYDRIFDIKIVDPLINRFNGAAQPSSKTFPRHLQDILGIDKQIQVAVLHNVLMDEVLSQEFAQYLPMIGEEIDRELLDGKGDLALEIAGGIDLLRTIIILSQEGNGELPLTHALINGFCENTINTLEKMLRLLTLKESYSVQFFEDRDLTLGNLLSLGKPELLPKKTISFLQYHLDSDKEVKSPDDRPGKNLRNIQMHNLGHKYKQTRYQDCLWFLYLLFMVLNELGLSCYEQKQLHQE